MKPQLTNCCPKCTKLPNGNECFDALCPCHLPTLESDLEKELDVFIEKQIIHWEKQGRDENARWGVRNFWTGFAPQTFKAFITNLLSSHRHSLTREEREKIEAETRLWAVEVLHLYALKTKDTNTLDLIEQMQRHILNSPSH